jgi:hypothetical protein
MLLNQHLGETLMSSVGTLMNGSWQCSHCAIRPAASRLLVAALAVLAPSDMPTKVLFITKHSTAALCQHLKAYACGNGCLILHAPTTCMPRRVNMGCKSFFQKKNAEY